MIPVLRRSLREFRELPSAMLVNTVAGAHWMPELARTAIYRCFGIDVSWHASVRPGVIIRGREVYVGAGTSVNYRCLFDARAPVVIGENCGIAIDVAFITSSHHYSDPAVRAGVGALAPIAVGDGTWIGSRVQVLGGVTIGAGCVIAAGAVVASDCAPHGLYRGIPAKRAADLPHA